MAATITNYTVWTDGKPHYSGPDLEQAVRSWDRATCTGPAPVGGISVQVIQGDLNVRDGWILHVTEDQRVYLNPALR